MTPIFMRLGAPRRMRDCSENMLVYAGFPDAAMGVCDSPAVYRPRDPRAAGLFALVEDNFDELERVWNEGYEGNTASGPSHHRILAHLNLWDVPKRSPPA